MLGYTVLKSNTLMQIDLQEPMKITAVYQKNKALKKILVLGNSHAFDLYWALAANEKFSSNFVLSSLNVFLTCSSFSLRFWISP